MTYQESTSTSARLQDTKFHTTQFLLLNVDKSSLFNDYFYSVLTQSSYTIPPVSDIPTPTITCSDIDITEEEVFHALISLDPSKSAATTKLVQNIVLQLFIVCCFVCVWTRATSPVTGVCISSLQSKRR